MVTKDLASDDYVAEFPTAQSVIDQLTAIGIKTRQDADQASREDALALLMSQSVNIPGSPAGRDEAKLTANMMVGMDDNAQGRPWKVFQASDGSWKYYYTKEAWDRPTTAAQAREIIAGLEADFPSDAYDWVVGDRNSETGVYDIIASKVGQGADKALDPNNPLMMGDDGTPTTIDLGNGQKMGFLSDGRSFTVDPAEVADKEIDWSTLKSGDVKVVTAGGEDFAVFPDGTKYQVGEKFAGGIEPSDVEVVSQVPLKDGTFAAIFNNGQIFRTGREIKPATVGYQSDVGKFQITQPDGSINFVDPTYPSGFTGQGGLEGYNMFQQRSGDVEDLGLPEVPARIEQLSGQQFIRGTQGELQPLNDVLDRVIEQALISGDSDKAIAFDDFRKRPSRADALQMALQYARSPADQTLISAISSGERYVSPPPAGELQQVGPPADFLQQAYQEFRDSMSGGRLPTPEEMEASMAPPPPTALEEAQLRGIELQNQRAELEIANLTRKGEDDHNAATSKIELANRVTDSKITSTENRDNIATMAYEDRESQAGGGTGTGTGAKPQQPGTTRMIGGPKSDYGIRDIATESVDDFLATGNWSLYEKGMEQDFGTGSKFNQAAALSQIWSKMGPEQKAVWGSLKNLSEAATGGNFKNAESLNAQIDSVLLTEVGSVVGYPNDETYNDWLRLSGFTAELGVGRNEHSATRRDHYERRTPEYWRDQLNLVQKEIDAGDAGDAGDAEDAGDAGDAGDAPRLEYRAEEGDPLDTGSAVDALNNAVAEVEGESKAADDRLAEQRAELEQTFIDQGFVKSGGEWVDASTFGGDQWSSLQDEGIDFEGARSGAGPAGGNYPTLDVGGFDPALAPGDPGYSYAPFSMATGDEDAPGTSVRSENLRIEDFESPIAHAQAVKQARDLEQGIYKPGYPGYEDAQARAGSQSVRESMAAARIASEEAKAREVDAQHQAMMDERARGFDPDTPYRGYYSDENVAIREAIADAPLAVHEALQDVSLLDLADQGTDAIAGFTEHVAGTIAEDPGLLVPSAASAVAQAAGSGIHQAYGATIGAGLDFVTGRYEERREEQREQQKEPEPIPYGEGRLGTRTKPNQMTLVGEEGPEIALFPDGTEIIPMKRKMKPSQAKRLKKRGVRGMQEGGIVFPGVDGTGEASSLDTSGYGGALPSGVRRTIAGQSIAPSRGYLSRAAGITLPSGQAMRNMLPEEMDILKDIGAQARIPERAFERELSLGIPSGQRGRGSARFLPLSLR